MGRKNFVALRVIGLGITVLGVVGLAVWKHKLSWQLPAQGRVPLPARRGAAAPRAPRALAPNAFPPLSLPSVTAAKILAGAKAQLGTVYDASYQTIAYPMGDVKSDRGACTDVVIRALRNADYDLQQLIHQDMKGQPRAYFYQGGRRAPDSNIDHRRVPNQMVYLRRHGQSLPLDTKGAHLETWQPGDIVEWNLSAKGTLLHTGIISDARNAKGEPLVVHNLSVCAEEDVLTQWHIIGHFRVGPPKTDAAVTSK